MGMDMHMHTAYSACSKEDETWCAVLVSDKGKTAY